MTARLRRLPLPVLLALMLVAGLCALLALNTASAAQELKQRALTDSNAELSDSAQQLTRDLAAKQAPGALASAAAAQGLVPNPNPAFLRLNADGSVTVLGSPAPASVAPLPPTPVASPPAGPKPSAAASPSATPGKPAASSSGRSAVPSVSSSVSPSVSGRTATSTAPAPVVTVTVTRSATPASPSRPASSSRPASPSPTATPTKSSAPGGH
jgi:hypothetical protein